MNRAGVCKVLVSDVCSELSLQGGGTEVPNMRERRAHCPRQCFLSETARRSGDTVKGQNKMDINI